MGKQLFKTFFAVCLCFFAVGPTAGAEEDKSKDIRLHAVKKTSLHTLKLPEAVPRFVYDSGLDFEYPEAVRGIYVTAYSAGGSRMGKLMKLTDSTDLNAMVIDIKDDEGNLTYEPEKDVPFKNAGKPFIGNPRAMLEKMEKREIYPIARIVVFKDSILAEKHPEYSFRENGKIWTNGNGEAFVNPFIKEVWDYNVNVAIEAAKMGFQEIQFDYVRFPEGFEKRDDKLKYSVGDYGKLIEEEVRQRVTAVTDFVKYAEKKLEPYDVDVSVDIFGYTATLPAAPGIGQNFSKIAEHVDIISSMIYPSHWTSYFGIQYPDLHPYDLVTEYVKVEKEKLNKLEEPPTTRPWIQDFTASWLSHYQPYGKAEVEAQIRALNDHGVEEFLIWDASNSYTPNVDYTPGK
jgi:hypothetical protein